MKIFRKRFIDYNLFNINKYKSSDNLLKHARYIPGKTKGIMLVSGDVLVGYIAWEDNMIIALEIIKEFRNKGIGRLLLDMCPASYLTVSKLNSNAIRFYENLGWRKVSNLNEKIILYKRDDNIKK